MAPTLPGRTVWDGAFRPGRAHDQAALQTDGIDNLLEQFPYVQAEMDAGYRCLRRDPSRSGQRPAEETGQERATGCDSGLEQARHAQSSQRTCVEHAIAASKHWRPLHRWIGRREDLPETIRAIGSLVSDRSAAW